MKKMMISLLAGIVLVSALAAQELYDVENITTIEITFEESNWDYLLDQLYSEGNEERLLGTAEVNGILFDSVGVRYKGNSSYSSRNSKNPLNIKLDYMISDQEYDNYGTLKLANVYNDPSFVREVLGYEIARDYMPASQCNYAKVWINGTYIGLYTSSQDVDKHFAASHFGSKSNSFFKGELTNSSPSTVTTIWGYNGVLPASYTAYFELESDEGWNDLINFLDVFNNDTENMEDVLNVDNHLWMLAYDNLMVNLDAPINFGHNYYLYQDNSGRFNPIIWDLNESFGVFSSVIGSSILSTTGKQQLSPYFHASSSYYPIISKILSDDSYKKMYVAHMKTMIEDYFSNGQYIDRALEIQAIIDEEVQNDPNKFYTYANFLTNLYSAISSGTSGPPGQGSTSIMGISQLMEARVEYLMDLADFASTAPDISELSAPESAELGEEITVTCQAVSADEVYFCYRNSESKAYTKTLMADDGAHGDGASGDGTYGIQVSASGSGIDYYIYAENSDAASFYPAGAEYTVNEIQVSGKLVINELLADNASIVTDLDGDYDDWIELYNNTENTIDLSGYFLSDDAEDLQQWTFPDTTIGAGEYLIIWADKDERTGELHANFKLSASGESLFLSDPDGEVLDEVSFSAQSEDISLGRYENGSGDFTTMTPSYSAENVEVYTGVDEGDQMDILDEFSLSPNYPNPFNPSTTLSFNLNLGGTVSLKVYNSAGKLVKTLVESAYYAPGTYNCIWQAGNMPSGVYFGVLEQSGNRLTQKMLLLK